MLSVARSLYELLEASSMPSFANVLWPHVIRKGKEGGYTQSCGDENMRLPNRSVSKERDGARKVPGKSSRKECFMVREIII